MVDQSKLQDILFDNENEVWDRIRQQLLNSNCLKTQTSAAIVRYMPALNKCKILSIGSNSCAPKDCEYGSKLSFCPRAEIKTGTNYELCAPLHAERMACLNIRKDRDSKEILKFASHLQVSEDDILSAFNKEELENLNGASLYLVGHYWACEGCVYFLKTVGINDIKLDKVTADKTKENYSNKNIIK